MGAAEVQTAATPWACFSALAGAHRTTGPDAYVEQHISVVMWSTGLCGVARSGGLFRGSELDRAPHNQRLARKPISASSALNRRAGAAGDGSLLRARSFIARSAST